MIVFYFDLSFTAKNDASPTGFESILYTCITIDRCTSREVGSFYIFHQAFHVDVSTGIYIGHRSIQHFTHVMRRHVRCHTYCDTGSTIHQQVRDTSRKYCRFFQRVIEVQLEVYCVFVNITKHFFGKLAQTCFGVTHCRRTIAVDRTKVTLSVYQRIT